MEQNEKTIGKPKQGAQALEDPFEKQMQKELDNPELHKRQTMHTKIALQMMNRDGERRIHLENPQEVLKQYAPKPGEEILLKHFEENPNPLIYDIDDTEEGRMLAGDHCP